MAKKPKESYNTKKILAAGKRLLPHSVATARLAGDKLAGHLAKTVGPTPGTSRKIRCPSNRRNK